MNEGNRGFASPGVDRTICSSFEPGMIANLLGSGATDITRVKLSGVGRDANEHAVPLDSVSMQVGSFQKRSA